MECPGSRICEWPGANDDLSRQVAEPGREGNRRNHPGKIDLFVGQSLVRDWFSCGTEIARAESAAPATVMQRWICSSCGTLNQFEIVVRTEI